MTHGTEENLAEVHEPSASEAVRSDRSPAGLLLVTECIPNGCHLERLGRLRITQVSKATEALSLPWIQKLPGTKRIKLLHGQVFILQDYLGCKVIRAHICRTVTCQESLRHFSAIV